MGGIDSYDWSPLGGNPAPGDPDAVRAIAASLSDLAGTVEIQNRLLQSVASDSESIWVGPAASAFRPHVDKLPGELAKLTRSYRDAADSLDGYWPRLAGAQQLAVEALAKYRTATAQLAAAEAASAQAAAAASAAADAYNQAATAAAAAPPDPSGATSLHLSGLQSAYQAASASASSATSALGAARAAVEAARSLAGQARTQARAAASTAAAGLHAASNAGIHNPHHSWFSSIVDDVEGVAGGIVHFVEHNWKWLVPGGAEVMAAIDGAKWLSDHWVQVLKDGSAILGSVATVAGFLAIIPGVGEIALPIALVASGLVTLDDAALAGFAGGSWWNVALDGVGDLGFGAGEMLSRTVEGIQTAESLASRSAALERQAAKMGSEMSRLNEAATGWDAVGDREVFSVGSDGETVLTKGSDMASALRTRAGALEERLASNRTEASGIADRLTKLPGEGQMSRWQYGWQTFKPGEPGGTISKVQQFFKSPSAYTDSILHPTTAQGDAAVSGFRQVTRATAREGWTGPAKTLFRINLAVGGAGTGLSTYQTVGAWHEAGRK